jgi:hypothetical protein
VTRWSRFGCFGFARGVQGDGWVGAGEYRWLGHDGESKKDGDAVATRAKPQATKTAPRRGSSSGVGVPHTGMCVHTVRTRQDTEREKRC